MTAKSKLRSARLEETTDAVAIGQAANDGSATEPAAQDMATVLVVDDEQTVRGVIAMTLRGAGYDVAEAETGKQCIAAIGKRLPDIVILDVLMPEQDGLETLRILRSQYRDLKILAISGGASEKGFDWLHIAKKFGANTTLAKPFSNRALLAELRTLLKT